MAGQTEFVGADKVLKNLNDAIKKITGRTAEGLTEAGLFIKGEAVKNAPIQYGNLRNSAYVLFPDGGADPPTGNYLGPQAAKVISSTAESMATAKGQLKSKLPWLPAVVIGFGAFYAVFVHEIQKNYNKGNWKYLERALSENTGKILRIIEKRAKI